MPPTILAPTPWQVSDGMIYLADGEHLVAVQASSGKPLWQRLASTFVLDRATGTLLALGPPTSHASLAALDPSSGQVLWQRAEPAVQSILLEEGVGLILSDGIVYLGNWQLDNLPPGMAPISFRGQVTALRASDGHYLWRYQGERDRSLSVAGTATTIYLLSYSPVANQTESRLIALQASSGKLFWQHGADPAAGMLLADQVLYTGYGGNGQTSGCLASGTAQLAAYRGSDGQQIWHRQTSNLPG